MKLLETEHLRKTYGDLVAVDDVSFAVEAGEIFGLLGPNGAGKSTTMMLLAGLLEPDSGTIILEGSPLSHDDRAKRKMLGVVPQDLSVYPNLTARENLYFFGRLYGVPRPELRKQIDNVLERTGLTDRADDLTDTYSGGMKRRLNFGAALLHSPRLLILDEPTVGVDPQSRAHLLDCIRELSSEGVAVLYASHYMEEVEAICGRIAIIDHGRMIACDRISVLLSQTESKLTLSIDRLTDDLTSRIQGVAELRPGNVTTPPMIVISNARDGESQARSALQTTLSRVLAALDVCDVRLESIKSDGANLERLFLQLTGNSLRD